MLYPTMLRKRITDVTLDDLRTLGVRAVLLDVDNTLTAHHSRQVSPEVTQWLQKMQRAGIVLTIVSNARPERVEPFARAIGLTYISLACKPLPFGLWRAMRACGAKRRECVAVGDQTFTDVLGAKLAGVKVIQLRPIRPESGGSFRLRRALERPILRRFEKKQQAASHTGSKSSK